MIRSREVGIVVGIVFSEAGLERNEIPSWAVHLIQLGNTWPAADPRRRRIALVSMPCDSAAAALIALGVLIRDLGNCDASDVRGHYDALLRFARQYLSSCRECAVRCRPEVKGCGYRSEAAGVLRDKNRRLYEISGRTDFVDRLLVLVIPNGHWQVGPSRALDLRIMGDPPLTVAHTGQPLPGDIFRRLVPTAAILEENLGATYSGVCLAGRVAGESVTRQVYESILFRFPQFNCTLADILSVQAWSHRDSVSRMAFFNARTEQYDRLVYEPELVIADGDKCFHKVLSRREFERSDIIAVVNRTVDRERLEALGDRLAGLKQWYTEDDDTHAALATRSPFIGILALKKREA